MQRERKQRIAWAFAIASLLFLVACGREASDCMTIHSPAFDAGGRIPQKHTGEGADVSPPLRFERVPAGTRQLVLIVDDPDAPRAEPWVHWVVYGLSPTTTSLGEGDAGGGVEGVNDFHKTAWGGPMPPPGHGVHHYHFRLYALDAELALRPGLPKDAVLERIEGHVLAQAELIGTYER